MSKSHSQEMRDLCTTEPKKLNAFEKSLKADKPCPKCGCHITRIYGIGFDYDLEYCSQCDYEVVYETSTSIV